MLFKNLLFLSLIAIPLTGLSGNTFYVTGNYMINGQKNPDIALTRGETYNFIVSVGVVHPFWLKSVRGTGTDGSYDSGVSANGITSGTIVFSVPEDAPNTLYYNCKNHSTMTGTISILDPVTSRADMLYEDSGPAS